MLNECLVRVGVQHSMLNGLLSPIQYSFQKFDTYDFKYKNYFR